MHRAAWVAAALLPALFAGCMGGEDPGAGTAGLPTDGAEDPPSTSTALDGRPGAPTARSLPLPEWRVADWWTYASDDGTLFQYVVARDAGADWWMGTPNEELAFRNARHDISFLGGLRKSDLAGSQGSDRVQFFQWPLADGATWTTRWDGLSLTITAAVPPEGPALLEGRRPDGSLHVAYTFDPQAGWFGEVAFHDENGTRRFGLTLSERGDSYVGDVLDWKLETLLDASGRGSMIDPARTVEVSAEATDLWTSYVLECPGGHGGYLISMRPVALEGHQQGYLANGACTDEVAFEGQAAVSPKDGPWSIAAVWGEGADSPVFEFLLLERTLVREAVAAA